MATSVTKFVTAEIKEFNDTEREITAWASKAIVDRDGEIIMQDGWKLDAFRQNPVILMSHDYKRFPLGKAKWIKTENGGLKFCAKFASTPAGQEAYTLYKEGILNGFSVGFTPLEWDDGELAHKHKAKRVYTKQSLLEISVVSIPSCPEALMIRGKSGALKTKEFNAFVVFIESLKKGKDKSMSVEKALEHNDTINETEPDWGSIDKTKLPLKAFVYDAPDTDNEKKSTWKYPHHYVEGGEVGEDGVYSSGDMYLHKGGLNAAWAAAQGARTGDKADAAIIAHLQAHRDAIGINEDNKDENKDAKPIVNKAADTEGNPSANDIKERLEAKMNMGNNGPYNPSQYHYCIEDLYPISYPDGHFIVEAYDLSAGYMKSTDKYWRYDYRWNNGEVEISGGLAMEETYKPVALEVSNIERSIKTIRKVGAMLSATNRARVESFRAVAADAVAIADELLQAASGEKKTLDSEPKKEDNIAKADFASIIKSALSKDELRSVIKDEMSKGMSRLTGRL